MTQPSWMIWTAITLHLTWAVMLLFSSDPLYTVPLGGLARIIPNQYILAAVLLVVVLCAVGWFLKHLHWQLIPQQFIVLITTLRAVEAAAASQYADGVIRPTAFIAADQMLSFLFGVFYTLAILYRYYDWGDLWKRGPFRSRR